MADSVNTEVSEVGLVFKTHLDIGFTDFSRSVLRRYMEDFIPSSLSLAEKTRGTSHRFVWTTGSWLAYHYLEHANAQGRQRMEEAIAAGDFYWHALPFTPHCELMPASLCRLGLKFSEALDRRFGRVTRGAKMTDVPGHTIGIVPLLAEAGIRFLHLGVNPASALPQVPSTFLWRKDGAEVVVSYEENYGGVSFYPGGKALSVNLTGDNLGPQNPKEIELVYARLGERFPNAVITPGGLDVIEPAIWEGRDQYPVVESEIGDTWIHGVGTDPMKVAQFHTLCRLREDWIANGKLEEAGDVDLSFGEQLLLIAEHTWGMDLKTHLRDWRRYGPLAFSRARTEANFLKLEKSWDEQRGYINAALTKLPESLKVTALESFEQLKPSVGRSRGWVEGDPASSFKLDQFELKLDETTGGIVSLRHPRVEYSLASPTKQLGVFRHQTFSKADYDRYYDQYIRGKADWNWRDFAKPGLTAVAKSAVHVARLANLELNEDGCRARLRLQLPDASLKSLGAGVVWVELKADGAELFIRLEWQEKQASRMPEAYWYDFEPVLLDGDSWRFNKLGSWIDPADVVPCGNRNLHAVERDVRAGRVLLSAYDATLIAPGGASLLDFSQRIPSNAGVISYNLYNNKWGTNFPMWYEDDAVFRFKMTLC